MRQWVFALDGAAKWLLDVESLPWSSGQGASPHFGHFNYWDGEPLHWSSSWQLFVISRRGRTWSILLFVFLAILLQALPCSLFAEEHAFAAIPCPRPSCGWLFSRPCLPLPAL